jgi:DNA-binding CsgD family transcriptional regulator
LRFADDRRNVGGNAAEQGEMEQHVFHGDGDPQPYSDLLTPREREVLAEIASGCSSKEAGRRLHISPRTVEVHRARIMDKLGARNAADLVRIVLGGSRGD